MTKLRKKQAGGFVYSTFGSQQEPESQPQAFHPKDWELGVRREKKGRAGKTVTLVILPDDFPGNQAPDLAHQMKKHCGTGGSVTPQGLVIQGDFVEKVIDFLKKAGYAAKKIGG